MQGHTGGVTAVIYSHINGLIVSGGDDNLIKIWSFKTYKFVGNLEGN